MMMMMMMMMAEMPPLCIYMMIGSLATRSQVDYSRLNLFTFTLKLYTHTKLLSRLLVGFI